MIQVETMCLGPVGVNTYVALRESRQDCLVFDPAEAGPVVDYLNAKGLSCAGILLTHGHFDHILGLKELRDRTGAPVYVHPLDADMLEDDKLNLAGLCGVSVPPCKPDMLVADWDTVAAAGMSLRVLHTPGHSPGSVCYVEEAERLLFSGDTLFRLSVGRSDFLGSREADLYRSLMEKLVPLPGDYRVFPGHRRETTLQFEREHNPFIARGRGWSE